MLSLLAQWPRRSSNIRRKFEWKCVPFVPLCNFEGGIFLKIQEYFLWHNRLILGCGAIAAVAHFPFYYETKRLWVMLKSLKKLSKVFGEIGPIPNCMSREGGGVGLAHMWRSHTQYSFSTKKLLVFFLDSGRKRGIFESRQRVNGTDNSRYTWAHPSFAAQCAHRKISILCTHYCVCNMYLLSWNSSSPTQK